jgi:WD40 repeat protein
MNFWKHQVAAIAILSISLSLGGCMAQKTPSPLAKIADRGSPMIGKIAFDQVTTEGVAFLTVTPDGRSLISGNGQALLFWDLESRKLQGFVREDRTSFPGRFQAASMNQSPGGGLLVSVYGSMRDSVKVWDLKTGVLRSFQDPDPEGSMTTAVVSPDGKRVACGTIYGVINIWDLATGQLKVKINTRQTSYRFNMIYALAVSPDSQTLISVSEGDVIQLWDFNTGRLKAQTNGFARWHGAIAVSSKNDVFVNGAADGVVRVWSIDRAILRKQFVGHRAKVTAVAISPDAQWIASGDENGVVNLWNTKSGTLEMTLPDFSQSPALTITGISFTPDGKSLIAGGIPQATATLPAYQLGYATGELSGRSLQTAKVWDLQSLRAGQKP